MADTSPTELTEPGISVALTHAALSSTTAIDRVRSPSAGAIVLFTGTTRDRFDGRPVRDLSYQSYAPLALRTMLAIARSLREKYAGAPLLGVAIVHRLGTVPVGEESVLVAVSSPHRKEAWLAGEECLEEVKARVEIWKLERFGDEDGGGVWRANRDGVMGSRVGDVAGDVTSQIRGDGDGDGDGEGGGHEGDEGVGGSMGPVIRPRRLGEKGHGAVVNPKPGAPSE